MTFRGSLAAIALAAPAVVACGARTELPGPRGDGATGGAPPAPCELVLAVAPTRVFPDSEENSEEVFSKLTNTQSGDAQCFFSLLQPGGNADFHLHQRCMHAFGAFDLGEDVIMGETMDGNGIVPPAEVLVAPGHLDGFALYYRNSPEPLFGPTMLPGTNVLPPLLSPPTRILLLGPSAPNGHFAVIKPTGADFLSAALVDANGFVLQTDELLCPPTNQLSLKTAHVGAYDIVIASSAGATLPDCIEKPNTPTIALRSTAPGSVLVSIPLDDPISYATIAPFGGDEGVVVVATNQGESKRVHGFFVAQTGEVEREIDLGEWYSGFGIGVTELGGALLLVQDGPHIPGQTTDSELHAELADPMTGEILTTLDIRFDIPLLDSPVAPVIVTNGDRTQALLGFFAQPLGSGGRDYVARLDCVPH